MFGGVWLGTSEKKESKNKMGWGKTLSFLSYFWNLSASGSRAQASSAKIFRRLWEEECTGLKARDDPEFCLEAHTIAILVPKDI